MSDFRHMDADIQRARQDLDLLPSSAKKSEALRLLAEIEKSEVEQKALLESLERTTAKCRLTEDEKRFYRWLPWFTGALGLMAAYGGIVAMLTKEFCFSSRGSWSCSSGLNAQIQGATVLLIGALLLLLSIPESRWRTISLWGIGLLLFPSVLGSLLVR
jgi:hypothetical protein